MKHKQSSSPAIKPRLWSSDLLAAPFEGWPYLQKPVEQPVTPLLYAAGAHGAPSTIGLRGG